MYSAKSRLEILPVSRFTWPDFLKNYFYRGKIGTEWIKKDIVDEVDLKDTVGKETLQVQ